MKLLKNILLMIAIGTLFTNCDLDLQEDFNFQPEANTVDPFADMTALEYIRSQVTTTETFVNNDGDTLINDPERFDFLSKAIEVAGFENEYDFSGTNRTYLLLNNNAFTGRGDIIDIITGSSEITDDNGTPDDESDDRFLTLDEIFANADVETLRTILRYHIVTTFIAQVPTLLEFDVNYIFQTLIPGETGRIAFRRDNRYRIDINRTPAPLPSTATSQFERVRSHNYLFSNGIGHIIADPVRYQPY